MIGAIAILVIAFWYFKTAEGRHLSAFPWITAGVAVYYLSFAAWTPNSGFSTQYIQAAKLR